LGQSEFVLARANAALPNMALTSWKGSVVRKGDIFIAKNYLNEDEIDTLNRLVVIFLETAELRVKNRTDITMNFWRENVDRLLEFNDKSILSGAGSISNAEMEEQVSNIYMQFDQKRKAYDAQLADEQDLKEIEIQLDKRKKKKE